MSLPYLQGRQPWLLASVAGMHLALAAGLMVERSAVIPSPPRPIRVSLLVADPPAARPAMPTPLAAARVDRPVPAPVRPPRVHSQPLLTARPADSAVPATPAESTPERVPTELPLAVMTEPSVAAATPAPAPAALPVAPARFDADYLNNPAPAYPPLSRRLGEAGQVLLHVLVGADGAASKVDVRDSSGFERLDRAARDAVRQWRFVPARQGDKAVAAWVLVPVSFSLRS